jgi:hypothetical protein
MDVSSIAHHYAKGLSMSYATPAQFRSQCSTYLIARWILIIIPPKSVILPTLYLTTEENKIFHLEETMTHVRWRHTILKVEKVNSFNITVLWIHHLTALQKHGVAM